MNICSFCLNVRWRSEDTLGRDRFPAVSRWYPVYGPVVCAAASGLTGAAGTLFCSLTSLRLPGAACMLLLFFLIRGIRLFDAYCDLSEGLTYAHDRDAEGAWKVIHSPSNGAFAILWAGMLLMILFCVCVYLVVLPVREAVSLSAACGALSAAGAVFCHTGETRYHQGSAFIPFASFCRRGEQMKTLSASGCCCLPLFTCTGFSLTYRIFVFLLLIGASFLTSRLAGRLVMRELKGFNGDVFGFISLVQYAFVLCLGTVLFFVY